jgi:uncharacterized membrane protein YfcA
MSFVLVALAALLVSGLTLFSGFGLGTLLMPVFALFFPVEVAVAATAVVHGANNAFKVALVGRGADRGLVLHFGVPAILAAFAGAAVLDHVSRLTPLAAYSLGGREALVTPIKLTMAVLMLVFALWELLPRLKRLRFDRRYLVLGGLLSGFFGGLSGHQGALRSAFLMKTGVSTEAFVGTNAAIGFLVDMARLAVYAAAFFLLPRATGSLGGEPWPLIATGIVFAFAGVLLGKRMLTKITMESIQTLTGVLLLGIAVALGAGLI